MNNNFIYETNRLLSEKDKNKLLMDYYFEIQKNAEQTYGKKTVVLIEIGSFYEIYETNTIGKARELSKDLNIILTKKDKNKEEINNGNPYMCGIPSITIERYVEKLIELNKWTIILIEQEKKYENNKLTVRRYVKDIISNGVNIKYNSSFEYNFITSLSIEKFNDIYYAGISFIDVSIGKTMVYESFGNSEDKEKVLEEIHDILQKYKTNEILINKSENITEEEIDNIKNTLELQQMNYIINVNQKEYPIEFKEEVLSNTFENFNTNLSIIEVLDLEMLPLATTSLVRLILFIIEHNPEIANKLKKPEILENKDKLYCGNNAINQLNIIEKDKKSIEKIINIAKTSFGRRYVKELLISPIKNKEELLTRYNNSQNFISLPLETKKMIYNKLFMIYDLERLKRQIFLKKIRIQDFYNFYQSLLQIKQIKKELTKKNFLIITEEKEHFKTLNQIIKILEEHFNLEQMKLFNSMNSDTFINIENKEYIYLKELIDKKELLNQKIKNFNIHFFELFETDKKELIPKIKHTEKEGYYLELSNSKYKELIKANHNKNLLKEYEIKLLKSAVKIRFKELNHNSNEILYLKEKIKQETFSIFENFLNLFNSKYLSKIEKYLEYIKKLDFYIVNDNLYSAKKYSKPIIIDTEKNEKFLEAKELRHIIVEEEEKGIYIPNDIYLGDTKYIKNKDILSNLDINTKTLNGIMLHGLNASGKSTLIKSVGVAIILAQSGFFVPAKEFRFSLFDSLFTRITGEDNIYKGLSTFTVEMLEMKNVFNRQIGKTIVLGDELSSGTETQSAIAIVAGGFITMEELGNLFFFATHLHQLEEVKEIENNENIIPLHLHVEFNKEKDIFVFNRKLKKGRGLSTYGLEYAKYLNLNSNFIKNAYKIRKEIVKEKENIEYLTKEKRSAYNKSVYIKNCVFCNKEAQHTHHIKEQKKSDKTDHIEYYHKNNKDNLIPLCEEHHKELHKYMKELPKGEESLKYIMTSSGKKLWINKYILKNLKIASLNNKIIY